MSFVAYGSNKLNLNRFEPVGHGNPYPSGGLMAYPYVPSMAFNNDYSAEMQRRDITGEMYPQGAVFDLKENVKTLTLDSAEDARAFVYQYQNPDYALFNPDKAPEIRWPNLTKDYGAVHVTQRCIDEAREILQTPIEGGNDTLVQDQRIMSVIEQFGRESLFVMSPNVIENELTIEKADKTHQREFEKSLAEYTQERINYMQSDENEWLEAGEDTEQEDEKAEQKPKQLNRELERYIARLEGELAARPSMVRSILIVILSASLAATAIIAAFIEAFGTVPYMATSLNYIAVIVLVVFALVLMCVSVFFVVEVSQANAATAKIKDELQKAKNSR